MVTANATVDAGTATAAFNSTLDIGSNTLLVAADEVTLGANVSGTGGNLTLQPGTTGASMQLGSATTAANQLDLTPTLLAFIQAGFSSVTFGRTDSTAAVTINSVSLNNPTRIAAGSSPLTVAGAVTSSADLQLVSGSGGIAVNGAVNVGANNLTLESSGPVTQSANIVAAGLGLLGTATFTLTLANNDVNFLAADISGSMSFTDADDLTVGTVGSMIGIVTGNPAAGGSVTITAAGYLTVDQAIDTSTGTGGVLTSTGVVFNAAAVLGAGNITLSGLNHPPALDLDANNSSGQSGADFAATFTEDGGAIAVADSDAVLSDLDHSQLQSLTVTLTNRPDGAAEALAANTAGTSITASYNSGTGVLTLSGADTVARYQQVLRTVTYNNSSQAPTTTARTITFVANDGTNDSNLATATITVSGVNDAPVAANEGYSTNEDTPLNVAAAGVLANDSDVEGNTLSAVLVTGPANGSLTLNADGSFSYTPNGNYNGTDSFTYRANDGAANSNLATVTITVNAVNDAPVAANESYSTSEDTPLNVAAAGVLANDSDVDGNPLTAVLVSGPGSGSLTLNANGSFSYTPNANFNGTDSFTYRANDGTANSNVATVTLTVNAVNDTPVAANESYSINEDTPLNVAAAGVLANDSDVDGNPLTAVLVSGPASGSLTLNANGSFSYTPNANFNGTDSFTYRANDGTINSNVATVTITVNAVNDAPVAANDNYSTNEDTPLSVAAAGVLANDSDVDGNPLTAVLVSGPANGSLTLNADGSFSYTPNANFNGSDSFTYRANDGTANSNLATVTITVNAVNDAPAAAGDSYSTNEDTPLSVTASGVLANDSDVDGNPLSAVLVSGPANGSLTLNANGSFSYTPNANFNGTDSFTYRANDGTANSNLATVTITVNAVNDAPVAANDNYSTNEDTPLSVAAAGVLANDSDVDGNPLSAVLVSGPANGSLTLNANGSFSYTPNANFNGSDSFTYRANDGTANSNLATVTITVNAVNDAPAAAGDSYSINEDTPLSVAAAGVLANDSDVEGNPLTAVLVSGPANGSLTLNANGSFSYTPNANFNGSDSFTYRANDGTTNSNLATVTITVNAVNDAPVAAGESYSTNEDTPLNVAAAGVLANDSDVDGNPLSAVLVSGPANGSLTLNANGSFSYTPNANFNGTDSFTYRANDGTANSNLATVTITVNAVNDAPVANNDGYTINEDTPLNLAAAGVLTNDSDVDGNPLTAVVVSGPINGSLTLNADGSFSYTPNANFNGTDSFTYRANDGAANSNWPQ